MERGWGIRRGWYVVAFILAAGLVGAALRWAVFTTKSPPGWSGFTESTALPAPWSIATPTQRARTTA